MSIKINDLIVENIFPRYNNNNDIGSSTNQFKEVYAFNFKGLADEASALKLNNESLINANNIIIHFENGIPVKSNLTIGSINQPVYIESGNINEISVIDVAHGGTGLTSLPSGQVLIGNNNNAITTKNITDITEQNYVTQNSNLITANTLTYWDGTYNSAKSSNLAYCNQGAFGTMATQNLSGFTMTGHLIIGNYSNLTIQGKLILPYSGSSSTYSWGTATPTTTSAVTGQVYFKII